MYVAVRRLLLNPVLTTVFDALCSVTSLDHNAKKTIALDHHIYDMLSDTWIKRRSKSRLYINLNGKVLPTDYEALGYILYSLPKPARIPAMADTGCQSWLTSVKVILRLGLRQSAVKMHAETVSKSLKTTFCATHVDISMEIVLRFVR